MTNTTAPAPDDVVLWGATLGFLAALAYGLAYAFYVVLRTSMQIISVLPVKEGLAATLAANAVTILVSGFSLALIFSIPAFVVTGSVTFLIRRLASVYNARRSPLGAIGLGGTTSALIAAALSVLARRLTAEHPDFFPGGYLTWVGIPGLILILLAIYIAWTLNRMEAQHD